MFVWLTSGLAMAADCPAATQVDQIAEALDKAEGAYVEFDEAGFQVQMDAVPFLVPCLDSLVPPELAAHYHRLRGIRAFGGGDPEAAQRAFNAARRADPSHVLSTDLVPEGHAIRELYASSGDDAEGEDLPPPRDVVVHIDGRPAESRAADADSLVQLRSEGAVTWSGLVRAGEPLPDYRLVPRTRNALLVGAAAGVAGAVVFELLAANTRAVYDDWQPDPGTPTNEARDQARGYQARIAGLTVGAGLSLGGALGAGAGALVVGER